MIDFSVDKASQYLFAFGKGTQYIWTVMPQSFTESPSYFSQTLKVDFTDIKLPGSSAFLHYLGDLLLCSPSQVSLQEDSLHQFRLLALKGHKVSQETLLFAQTLV